MSLSSNLYSHPGKPLENHIIKVGELSYKTIVEAPLPPILGIEKEVIAQVAKITGLCHDIGKATKFFQKYLESDESEKNKLKNDIRTHHSLLSSIVAFYEIKSFLEQNNFNKDIVDISSFHGYWVVKRHHSDLEDIKTEIVFEESNLDVLKEQIENISETKLKILSDKLIKEGLPIPLSKETLNQFINNFKEDLETIKRKFKPSYLKNTQYSDYDRYILNNLLFSSLISGDKLEAILSESVERNDINFSITLIENFKKYRIPALKNKLNDLRNKAYNEVISKEIDINKRIFSINLPTGLGKTLTSFALAFKLRETLRKEKGFLPRIIYALPFLSIIDQNFTVIKSVLETNGIQPVSSILLEHHHLSDVRYSTKEREFETDESKILIESWNSEIIITTFVQLFETMFSNRNSKLIKFNKLSNSIIILDEIQAIPTKYWEVIDEFIKVITDKLNSYVIILTATKPYIFAGNEIFELTNNTSYFNKVDRVTIISEIEKEKTLEEFADDLSIEKNKRYLFILNTISSAKKFYILLKEKIPNENIEYLSSHVTPYERLIRIRNLNEKKTRFAVTTQLVEAGVDIDFDVIYRDFAPFDSIIQSAGRCNRNWKIDKGNVFVVKLKDDKRPFASYIYDSALLDATKRILTEHKKIEEHEIYDIMNEYYNIVKNKISFDTSKKLIEAIKQLRYTNEFGDNEVAISEFALIEDEKYKIDVFVELNEEAKSIWQKFESIFELNNTFEKRIKFDEIKKDFYQFVISVPEKAIGSIPIVNGFAYINYDSLNDFYDPVTGFIKENYNLMW